MYNEMKRIDLNNKTILVTGAAGFIGANLVKRLLRDLRGATIIGLDNMNDYYDVALKEYRLEELRKHAATNPRINYQSVVGNIADKELIDRLFAEYQFDIVVNLAAQAGVRYSIENPDVYIESNIIGFYNILEACRHSIKVKGERRRVSRGAAFGICFFVERVWRQQEGAVLN